MLVGMAYVGNLTCRDCGLTFTDRWGPVNGADEYRCEANDHVVLVCPETGQLMASATHNMTGRTLADVFGRCPVCQSDLVTGLLPSCPVCNGRDHDVAVGGVLG